MNRLVRLPTCTRWRNQGRSQWIGTAHLDTTRSRVGMIERQGAAPGKGIRFGRLSRAEGDAGRGFSAPIIESRAKQDRATGTARGGMERRGIRHRDMRATAHPGDGRRAHRHVYRGHFERHEWGGWLRCWPSRVG